MSNKSRRERWFKTATAVTDRLFDVGAGRYLCPLCLRWFAGLGELSLEHAPPESVGGRQVALTCRGCNNTAGATMDAELRRVETLREFGARRMTNPMPATMTVKGISQRVETTFGPDGLAVVGINKRNHPAVAPTLTATFDRLVEESSSDWSIALSFPTPNMRLAAIGWLRAAYLVAFAALGYGYIVRRELDVVREQIRTPSESILERFCLMTRDGPGFGERRILLACEPEELESVLVFSNESAVFLPSAESDGTYERIAQVDPWPPGESHISGKSVPWPTEPVFGFDRAAGATTSPRARAE